MANALYPAGKDTFLTATYNWETDDFRCALIRDYTYSGAHQTVADVTGAGGSVVQRSGALTNATATNGVADADDVTFTSISGADVDSLIIYAENTGVDSGRHLIAYIDDVFPVTPDGSDIIVSWDVTNKIFSF